MKATCCQPVKAGNQQNGATLPTFIESGQQWAWFVCSCLLPVSVSVSVSGKDKSNDNYKNNPTNFAELRRSLHISPKRSSRRSVGTIFECRVCVLGNSDTTPAPLPRSSCLNEPRPDRCVNHSRSLLYEGSKR
jgi:hypothetical protein